MVVVIRSHAALLTEMRTQVQTAPHTSNHKESSETEDDEQ
jgi:hypothetical protein